MATKTITFQYVEKCDSEDPHVVFDVLVDGVARLRLNANQSQIVTGDVIERDNYEEVAWAFLRSFAIKWKESRPNGTLNQLRIALEAESWRI